MTRDEAMEYLGLMPFEEFLTCPKRMKWITQMEEQSRDPYIKYRATGRTTSMLLDAMVFLSENPGTTIYIVGHRPSYSRQLCYQAQDYAYKGNE